MPASITATPAAKAALSRLRSEHGDIILHVTGGWCAFTPLVLARGDLHLGPRDNLLGHVDGVPVYKMLTEPAAVPDTAPHVLDIVDGMTIGFSLEAAPGKHFMLTAPAEGTGSDGT